MGWSAGSIYRVANRDGWNCAYCGADLTSKTATADHVVPQSQGGPARLSNLVLACRWCNVRKGDRSLLAFFLFCDERQSLREALSRQNTNRGWGLKLNELFKAKPKPQPLLQFDLTSDQWIAEPDTTTPWPHLRKKTNG